MLKPTHGQCQPSKHLPRISQLDIIVLCQRQPQRQEFRADLQDLPSLSSLILTVTLDMETQPLHPISRADTNLTSFHQCQCLTNIGLTTGQCRLE